jgi:hypothetical protein
MSAETNRGRWCPSARCESGAVLLGIVGADGRIGFITPEIQIDDDFVQEAHKGRLPETRFRFGQPCIEDACAQWTGSRCGVIDRLLPLRDQAIIRHRTKDLPRCSIRSRCRWFAQVGGDACHTCPLVVTEQLADSANSRLPTSTAQGAVDAQRSERPGREDLSPA